MISLSSEITDSEGSRAAAGWVFFDGTCEFCTRLVRRWQPALERRGFGFARVQDPRVQALLALPEGELLREMKVFTASGQLFGGADAVIYLAGKIWWTRPLAWLARLPGVHHLMEAGYRYVAALRSCTNRVCAVRVRFSESGETQEQGGHLR